MDHQETQSEDQQIPAAVPARNRYLPGFRFLPTDKVLIVEYLQKKIDNKPIPVQINETFIKHVNPRDLTANNPKLGDNEWYFFTPRDWKYSNGERPDRAADAGYWKATGADKPVIVGAVILGFRRTLEFYEGKPPNGQKTVWKMHEFRVNGVARKKTSADDMRLDDWVLCRVYAKSSRVANNRKSPVQSSREAALVINQEMIENVSIVPENPKQNMINTDFSVQDLLQESDPKLSYFESYNLDGIVAPIEQQLMNNPYVNGEPLPLPNVDAQQANIGTNFCAPMPNKT